MSEERRIVQGSSYHVVDPARILYRHRPLVTASTPFYGFRVFRPLVAKS